MIIGKKQKLILALLIWLESLPGICISLAQEVSFVTRRDFAAGTRPTAIAVGDFNGDAIQDLAVTNTGSNRVSILLGQGDGTFGPARSFDVGRGPSSIAVGDFNGDAFQDLALAHNFGAITTPGTTVSILLGRGDGTFGPPQSFQVGVGPKSVVVGDFNGDELQDLAVANAGAIGRFGRPGTTVSVLLGRGDGTFEPARAVPVGVRPSAVVIADFNGDSVQDMAVANVDSHNVSILLGNGDGTFAPARNIEAGAAISIAAGDFNGDEIMDLVLGNGSLLLGNGDGTFRHAPALGIRGSITIGDFDNDGTLDLAVVNAYGSTSVLLGNGNGTFRAVGNFGVGTDPTSIAVGNFNSDDIQDLAVTNTSSDSVSILFGYGDGAFRSSRNFNMETPPTALVVGDFNGDALPDLAVTKEGDGLFQGSGVSVLLGNGDGTFRAAQNFRTGIWPKSAVVGDFNGDRIQDLAVANAGSNDVSILLGNGDGTFRAALNFAVGTFPTSIAVGDFDNDAIQDLAVANSNSYSNEVSVLLGNGDGTFRAALNFTVGRSPSAVAVGDFDGDKIQDLAVTNYGDSDNPGTTVSVLLGNGDGTFRAALNFTVGALPTSVAVGDFNMDEIPDLAVTNLRSDNVSILLGNGDGTFRAAQNFPVGSSPRSIITGDFNGDGIQDLAVAKEGTPMSPSGIVSILIGRGDGTFGTAQNFGVGRSPQSIAVGDFKGDGRQDLATANGGSYNVSVLINETPQP
jgi:hypothetical protein